MKSLLFQRIKLQFLVNHCQAIFFFFQTRGGLEIGNIMPCKGVGAVEWMRKNNHPGKCY